METRYGRYLACTECGNKIVKESDAFTRADGRPMCQECGLKAILSEKEQEAIRAIKAGSSVIEIRSKCSTLRVFPNTNPAEESMVKFSDPNGRTFCIVRANVIAVGE